MKKFAIVSLLLCSTLHLNAQRTPHAIGFHFGGSTIDFIYQYHFSNKNFLDISAGVFDLDDGFLAQGVYNWNIQEWSNWTPRFGTWKFWGGFGGGIGFYDDDEEGLLIGPVGNLGFGFTLKNCPLSLGVDYRPMVAFATGNDAGLIDKGFRNIGLSLTFRF